jgi:chromosome segregation ATPase
LSEAKSKSEALQASLTQAETKSTELGKNLKDAIENVKVAEAKVEEVNKALGGKDPVVLKAEALKAQEDLTTLQREKKIIDDQLAAVNAEVARLKDIKERSLTGKLLPGINGRVLTVNKAWSFVVLNVGLKAGVVENGVLMVYRGEKLLGKVKVVSAEENSSVADIIPEWSKGEIQAGDDVFN